MPCVRYGTEVDPLAQVACERIEEMDDPEGMRRGVEFATLTDLINAHQMAAIEESTNEK